MAALLRQRRLRPTRARRLVLARLRTSNDHASAEDLRRVLRRSGQDVSIATLYQNLKRLTQAGLLVSFADAGGIVRFDANTGPHAHLVCTSCGRIHDIAPEDLDLGTRNVGRLKSPLRRHGWSLSEIRLELRGRCPRCRR